ncbi:MAG TPA: hypothetical protein VMT69_08765 [Kineosporiaceae bacterium]|nr:hypothetical protein [Kineosporiaceae bacterium]
MQIPKSQLVDYLSSHGMGEKAQLVQDQLPDVIDLDEYNRFLQEHGIDPASLAKDTLGDFGKTFGL